jgi:hypothetical protein
MPALHAQRQGELFFKISFPEEEDNTLLRNVEVRLPSNGVISQKGIIFRDTAGKTSKFASIEFLTDKVLLTMTFRGLNSRDVI